jgi:ABC-type multidrug transport system fused ATPase/permease subunit
MRTGSRGWSTPIQILVLEQGRVIEQGRHRELLARRGHYAQMCTRQQEARRV